MGKCPRLEDCDTNCVEQEVCKPLAKDINNEACPDSSASHGCPINCCDGTIVCPQQEDALGCLGPQECFPTTKGMNNATCPEHSDCPTICEPNEVLCPVTETDDNLCKLPDECILQERDHAGELCTVHCPIDCEDDETWCPGQRNEMGCFEPDQCVKRPIKTVGNDKGGVLCPSMENTNGCKEPAVCMARTVDKDGQYCPAHSVCPATCCPCTEIACTYGVDDRGCQEATLCRAKGKNFDDEYCEGVCPPTCSGSEFLTSNGNDARGCEIASSCVPIV